MNSTQGVGINYSVIAVLLFTALCWLGLYGLWANFAAQGMDLIRHGDFLSAVAGGALIALHAFGVLLVLACCAGVIAVTIRSHRHPTSDHRPHRA